MWLGYDKPSAIQDRICPCCSPKIICWRDILAELCVDGQNLGVAHKGEGQDGDGIGRLKWTPTRHHSYSSTIPDALPPTSLPITSSDTSQGANCFPVINSD